MDAPAPAEPSVVCVSGHAKKLVRLGDTKSGSGEGYGHSPLPVRWSACMYVFVCVCVCPCSLRACVQQDATGALGTCIRTRMRARQTHADERGGKRGQRSRHTLDAPAFEYLPASQVAHVSASLPLHTPSHPSLTPHSTPPSRPTPTNRRHRTPPSLPRPPLPLPPFSYYSRNAE